MGEARSAVKAVAAACGEMIDAPVQAAHDSMRVQVFSNSGMSLGRSEIGDE